MRYVGRQAKKAFNGYCDVNPKARAGGGFLLTLFWAIAEVKKKFLGILGVAVSALEVGCANRPGTPSIQAPHQRSTKYDF